MLGEDSIPNPVFDGGCDGAEPVQKKHKKKKHKKICDNEANKQDEKHKSNIESESSDVQRKHKKKHKHKNDIEKSSDHVHQNSSKVKKHKKKKKIDIKCDVNKENKNCDKPVENSGKEWKTKKRKRLSLEETEDIDSKRKIKKKRRETDDKSEGKKSKKREKPDLEETEYVVYNDSGGKMIKNESEAENNRESENTAYEGSSSLFNQECKNSKGSEKYKKKNKHKDICTNDGKLSKVKDTVKRKKSKKRREHENSEHKTKKRQSKSEKQSGNSEREPSQISSSVLVSTGSLEVSTEAQDSAHHPADQTSYTSTSSLSSVQKTTHAKHDQIHKDHGVGHGRAQEHGNHDRDHSKNMISSIFKPEKTPRDHNETHKDHVKKHRDHGKMGKDHGKRPRYHDDDHGAGARIGGQEETPGDHGKKRRDHGEKRRRHREAETHSHDEDHEENHHIVAGISEETDKNHHDNTGRHHRNTETHTHDAGHGAVTRMGEEKENVRDHNRNQREEMHADDSDTESSDNEDHGSQNIDHDETHNSDQNGSQAETENINHGDHGEGFDVTERDNTRGEQSLNEGIPETQSDHDDENAENPHPLANMREKEKWEYLHSKPLTMQSFVEECEQLIENGIDIYFETGRFSYKEEQRLKKNWKKFFEKHPLSDPYSLLHTNRSENADELRRFIKDTNFYAELGKGIKRPIYSIYLHAKIIFTGATRRGKFNEEEIEKLAELYENHGKKWITIGQMMGRSRQSVEDRFKKMKKEGIVLGPWTEEENQQLLNGIRAETDLDLNNITLMQKNLPWVRIARHVPTRTAKQCRQHWLLGKCVPGRKCVKNSDQIKLITRIYKSRVRREQDIDWDDIIDHFESLHSYECLRRRWYRLKVKYFPDHRKRDFEDIIEHLYKHVIPDLKEKTPETIEEEESETDE